MGHRGVVKTPLSPSRSFRLVVLILLSQIKMSIQSIDDGTPINITLAAINVEVAEKEDRLTVLGVEPLFSCEDDDPTRAFILSMTPSSPCSTKCFLIYTCGSSGKDDFCLAYVPGQGSLTFASAPTYTLTVGCTDDVETAATATLTVTVVSNTPPTFSPSSPLSVNEVVDGTATAGNTVIYDANAVDIDSDPVFFSMGTSPNTELLTMGYANGKIYATNDLLFFCETSVDATVSITDSYNPSVGPLNIAFSISPSNTAPSTTSLDTTVSFAELTTAGTVVHPITINDDGKGDTLTANLRSTSSAGLEMYELTDAGVVLKIDADYEREDTRSIRLYIDLTDGYCNSQTYSLTLNVLDVNEAPYFHPEVLRSLTIYETDELNHVALQLYDDDAGDTHTYTKTGGNFDIDVDATTGAVYSTLATYDLDPNKESETRSVQYQVTDSGGLTADGLVSIVYKDANDNPPVFRSSAYALGANPCTPLGQSLGTMTADDNDSPFENNNAFHFYGGGGRMAVTATGQIILTEVCVEGQTTTGIANVRDHGIYPGQLDGAPATLTLVCGACPPPATVAGATTVTTSTTPAPTVSVDTDDEEIHFDDFLAWVIPASILFFIWLLLTIFFLYRYCQPCNCRKKSKPAKVKPERKPNPPKPQQPQPKPTPRREPTPPPPRREPDVPVAPPPRQPTPQPYVFTYWEECFTDQDYRDGKRVDNPTGRPRAVEEMPADIPRGNEPPPAHLRLGDQAAQPPQTNAPGGPAQGVPKKKSGFCAIL